MSHTSVIAVEPVARPARVPLLPAVLASIAVVPAAMALMLRVLKAIVILLIGPDDFVPPGVKVVNAPASHVILEMLVASAPPLLAMVALIVTWHAAFQRRTARCWWAAAITVALAIGPFFL